MAWRLLPAAPRMDQAADSSSIGSWSPVNVARWVLAVLLAFTACNAFGGGWYGLSGAAGVPQAWLAHSPFQDYFVPSFVLLVVVGGSLGVSAIAVLARAAFARRAAQAAGVTLLAWIVVQVAIIGYVSWLQPASFLAGLLVVAVARVLPRPKPRESSFARSFVAYYRGAVLAPRATFDALCEDPRRLRFGTWALTSNAALYTLVYLFLVMGNGRPTVFKPWLALPAESYYRYDAFLLAPSMFAAWLLAAGVVQLFGKLLGGSGSFEDTLAVLGFGIAIASWSTLLHDLLTSCLGAFHVIDQRAYEDAMSSPTPFRALIWTLMVVYLVAFLALFTKAIASAQRLRPSSAVWLAWGGFAAYQGVFVLFNR